MLKKQIDWLWSAIKVVDKKNIFFMNLDCGIATDTIRMHIVNDKMLPDNITKKTDIVLNHVNDLDVESSIVINSEFLIDALKVFNDKTIIEVLRDKYGNHVLRLYDGRDGNEAIVMCCEREVEK